MELSEGSTIELKTALLAIVLPVVLVLVAVIVIIVLIFCCCPGNVFDQYKKDAFTKREGVDFPSFCEKCFK